MYALSFILFTLCIQISSASIYGHIELGPTQAIYPYVGDVTCAKWVTGILTTVDNIGNRNWVRSNFNMSSVFLIGSLSNKRNDFYDRVQELRTEISQHQDIVVFGMKEQYNSSLTQKVQAFFQVIDHHCPETQFVLKTDDDVWFNLTDIKNNVEKLPSPVYYGKRLQNYKPKPKESKYYDPIFKNQTYPPYASGWGYVLDRAALHIVTSQRDSIIFPNEDVHTGILLKNVPLTNSGNVFYGNVAERGFLRATPGGQGGIGNQLFFWASAIGIAKRSNLTRCLWSYDPQHVVLGRSFQMNETPICQDSRLKRVNHLGYDQTYTKLDTRVRRVAGKAIETIQLFGYFQSFKFFANVDIRRQLQFRTSIRHLVAHIFKERIPKAEHYVGIHVRRGDILTHGDSQGLYRITPPDEYFVQAKQYYRNRLGNNITFVVVSDDKQWCRNRSVFRNAHILQRDYPATVDMAILSSCNHTIMSVGTFGWWSAWLANGTTIYYADEFNLTHPDVKNRIRLADYYPPNWIPLRPKKPILWTSTKNISLIPQKSIDLWKKYTKGYELRVYDNRQTYIFMNKYAPRLSFKLFSSLQGIRIKKKNAPHAYDIWRATALYYFGGVYLDDKIQLQHQLSELFDPEHINFMNGVAYPKQGIATGVVAAPAKHPVLDEFIVKVVAQGLPFTNYHNYCIKMYNAVEKFQGNVNYLEQIKVVDGCEHDIYRACYYLKHPLLGVVGRIRPPVSEYPWANVTNATGLILSESGDYYTLSA